MVHVSTAFSKKIEDGSARPSSCKLKVTIGLKYLYVFHHLKWQVFSSVLSLKWQVLYLSIRRRRVSRCFSWPRSPRPPSTDSTPSRMGRTWVWRTKTSLLSTTERGAACGIWPLYPYVATSLRFDFILLLSLLLLRYSLKSCYIIKCDPFNCLVFFFSTEFRCTGVRYGTAAARTGSRPEPAETHPSGCIRRLTRSPQPYPR